MLLPPDLLDEITRFCAYRERSVREAEEKLTKMGANTEQRAEAITFLKSENYLNDQRFAIAFAGGKFRTRKWGKNQIIMHLKQKGITGDMITRAMATLDDDSYRATVTELAFKKWSGTKGSITERKAKVFRFLLSKGYEAAVAGDAIKSLGQE